VLTVEMMAVQVAKVCSPTLLAPQRKEVAVEVVRLHLIIVVALLVRVEQEAAVLVRLQQVLSGTNGTALTGGGAGGGGRDANGGAGGAGVVVLRVPNTAAAVFSGGVATRSYDVVGYTTYEVQATTTTGETVTFYPNAFLAEYLVVAGGASGGRNNGNGAGGGGAGGYLASANAVAMAVVTGQEQEEQTEAISRYCRCGYFMPVAVAEAHTEGELLAQVVLA
jgi:hypothetical protein